MTLDHYLPQQDLKYYLSKDTATQRLIQHEVLEHYLLEHELATYSKGWISEIQAIMYWDLKWYESKERYEICFLLKTIINNINQIANEIRL